ncbi:MAG: hypothetical protein ACPG46_04380 [Thalassotalea sp.]
MMKIANKTLAIIPLVVGLGATASASANQQTLMNTLNQSVAAQAQEVTESITTQVKQSSVSIIAASMAHKPVMQWNEKQPHLVIANTSKQNINTTTSGE